MITMSCFNDKGNQIRLQVLWAYIYVVLVRKIQRREEVFICVLVARRKFTVCDKEDSVIYR